MLETCLPHVYRFALHILADHDMAQDVAQEVMLRAWRNRNRLQHLDAGTVWLFKITANLCTDQIRRRQRYAKCQEMLLNEPVSNEQSATQQLIEQENIERVKQMMAELPLTRRQVLYLHAFERLKHEQIARVLNMTIGSVKVTLSQARRSMREKLAQADQVQKVLVR